MKMKVLYVEDHLGNIELMKRLMAERPQVDLLIAETGADGLALANQKRPGLLFLDWNLPDLTAEQFVVELKSLLENDAPPVVVLTADVSRETQGRMVDMDIEEFVSKPYDLDSMLDLIDSYLEKEQ
ncbi:MAG TPA: response regulator [Acidimicrobiales bacterium]|nr:response regulator [Acidimicrobiales bacterium]